MMIGSIMNALDGISSVLDDGKISWMDKQMLVFILKFIKEMAKVQLTPKSISALIRVLKEFCSDIQASLNGREADPALKDVLDVVKDVIRSLDKILKEKKSQGNEWNQSLSHTNGMQYGLNHGAQGVSLAGVEDVSSDSGEDDIVEQLGQVSPIHQPMNEKNVASIQALSKVGDVAKPGESPKNKNNDILINPADDSKKPNHDGRELTEDEHQKVADIILTLLEKVHMAMALETPKLDGIINTLDKLKNRATP